MAKVYEYGCPCKGCKDRVVGCHVDCEKYKAWKGCGIEIPRPFFDEMKAKRRKK